MLNHKLLLASEFNVVLDNPVIPQLLAGCKKLVFISTASKFERYSTYAPTQGIDKLAAMGIETTPLELSVTPPILVYEKLIQADIVYIGGGNTFVLLEHMNKTSFTAALKAFLTKGGLYIGSSAGACVACPNIGFIAPMDQPEQADLADYTAMGLVPWAVVPHFKQANTSYGVIAAEIAASLKAQHQPSIILQDHQALYIENGVMEIIG